MPVREAPDRRGRAERGSSGLLERDAALRAIHLILDRAEAGGGEVLLIEGHAGMGKTRLHEAAIDDARERGMRILRAAGAELEQTIALGVAAQLLAAQLNELPPSRQRALLESSPQQLQALAGTGEVSEEVVAGGDLALSHGLFTLLATADESRPALIVVDDLHWSDGASLGFLLYMLHRLEDLPIAMLLTLRSGHGGGVSDALGLIATHPRVRIEHLRPLGHDAVGDLVTDALGRRATAEVVKACLDATAGNPFYLRELLLALREDRGLDAQQLAQRARGLAPDAVARIVRVRVGRLGTTAAALARSVAILGDDAPLRHAARLAGLTVDAAAAAADALAEVEILLAREPLRFVHPLVGQAITRDIPASERASRHLDAARLLDDDGAGKERIASHLLLGRDQGDEWVVDELCAAAHDARRRSAPQSAVSYLLRALEEPPRPPRRPSVLAALGIAEAMAGLPSAAEHLAFAIALTDDPVRRAELGLERGRALDTQGLHEQAASAFELGLSELGPDPVDPDELELHDQLQAGFVASATMVPSLQAAVLGRSTQVLQRTTLGSPQKQGDRLLLAQAALQASFSGERAEAVIELAERAWDEGRLLEQATPQWVGWRLSATALCLAGELERSIAITDAAIDDARRRSWPLASATAAFTRALPQLWRGRVDDALADLESARDARRYGWHQFARAAAAHYALCLIERDEPDRAEEVLFEDSSPEHVRDLEDALRLYSLGAVRLAQGRGLEALEIALTAGEMVERTVEFFGYCPWRTAAAQAALALGEGERALELAREAAIAAERTQVVHLRIHTLRVLGLCQRGDEGIETLRSAVRLGRSAPPRLETIRALLELGAALRRANRRAAAREPLELAADLALQGGALALSRRARTELAASGARPRRERLLSGPASLTPSERRIAELAAAGKGNREIAQGLFVTPKTVEYHLRNVYRKLGIERRRELAEALSS
jgi:DNA-binding CsgD family transcriptional regulator